jgi:hypothetical protein
VYEHSPWVRVDDRVTMLTPAVEAFALSPGGRYLAWVEDPPKAVVHVTELASLRTVYSLQHAGAFALLWQGEEVLRVFDAVGRRVTATRHAVPDGGTLGVATMPRESMKVDVHSSCDGRVSMVTSSFNVGWRRPLWLVGVGGDDAVAPVPLDDVPQGLPSHLPLAGVDCALSPDGHRLVLVVQRSLQGSTVRFMSVEGQCLSEASCPMANGTPLGWLSPTEVLFQGVPHDDRAALVRVALDGTCTALATFPSTEGFEWVGLHPERDRVLLRRLHPMKNGYERTVAVCLVPTTGAVALLTLSHGRLPSYVGLDGGVCWTTTGEFLTLTQSPPGVAHLTRREVPGAPGRRLATFGLPGERPHGLALTASSEGTRFVATWHTFDRGPLDAVRRLALLDV